MVAAPAPVIDLVVLDPNNPRSIAFQFDRIETHLAALPKRGDRPAVAARADRGRARDPDADRGRRAIDEPSLREVEAALMKLSDVIGIDLFHHAERSEAPWEALG